MAASQKTNDHLLIFRISVIALLLTGMGNLLNAQIPIWTRHEISFSSSHSYDNPLYEVSDLRATFTAPSGRIKTVGGFWDGGAASNIRFI